MIKSNNLHDLKYDIPASLVVFLVALPLCLGIALGSHAPLISGLVAGIVGGIVVGVLSGSSLSVTGPAAGLTAIVIAALEQLPSFEAFLVAVVLAGVFQVVLGFLRAGVIGDYIPTAVIKGMLTAIGLILILKQFPHMIGYDTDYEGDESFLQVPDNNTFSGLFQALQHVLPLSAGIGLLSLLIQKFWDSYVSPRGGVFRFIPAPLVVVGVGASLAAYVSSRFPEYALLADHLVEIPIISGFTELRGVLLSPEFLYLSNPQVWLTALTIAIVASLETLLCIEASDSLDPYKRVTPTNRELKAQGVGNMISGFLGGLPVTSVIVRTSANINAGAKSSKSAILHGVLLLVSVLTLPQWLNLIPKSALAAVLIYTGFKLAHPSVFRQFYRKGLDQFIPFMTTIVAILFTDLLVGILIGCLVGLVAVLWSNFKSAIIVVHDDQHYLFRFRKDVSYLNKAFLKRKLESVPPRSSIIIDVSRADFIDKDVMAVVEDFIQHASLKEITVSLRSSPSKQHIIPAALAQLQTN